MRAERKQDGTREEEPADPILDEQGAELCATPIETAYQFGHLLPVAGAGEEKALGKKCIVSIQFSAEGTVRANPCKR